MAVVSSATSGIGKEAAWALARLGAQVTLVGRTRSTRRARRATSWRRAIGRRRRADGGAPSWDGWARRALGRAGGPPRAARCPLKQRAGCYPARRVITRRAGSRRRG
ncbi:MAG: hypothetical protein HS111_23385 [Kofleriaceae bacterium]|nr:hypothetical protein [Kofleriaceae bacterium]